MNRCLLNTEVYVRLQSLHRVGLAVEPSQARPVTDIVLSGSPIGSQT